MHKFTPINAQRTFDGLEKDPLLGSYLLDGQAQKLYDLALSVPDGGLIVEIGSFLGRSTIALGLACLGTNKRVIAIDTFQGNKTDFRQGNLLVNWHGISFKDLFLSNVELYGLKNIVVPLVGYSNDIAKHWTYEIDLLFIDGDHTEKGVTQDFRNFFPWVRENGVVSLHDVLPSHPSVLSFWGNKIVPNISNPSNLKGLASGIKTTGQLKRKWILIPTYKEVATISRLLQSLKKSHGISEWNVVVIDDGSDRDLETLMQEHFPDFEYLRTDNGDLFWAGSIDFALSHLQGVMSNNDVVCLINADTLLQPNTLERLLSAKKSLPRDSNVGANVLSEDNHHHVSNGGTIHWHQNQIGISPYQNQTQKKHQFMQVEAIFGRCSLFSASLFVEDGLRFSDSGFKQYWSDTVFCLRAKEREKLFFIDFSIIAYCQDGRGPSKASNVSIKKAYMDLRRPSNYNLKDLKNFINSYFPEKNFVRSAVFYYSCLKICQSFKRVPVLYLPMRVIQALLFRLFLIFKKFFPAVFKDTTVG